MLTINDLQLLHTVHRAYQCHQRVLPKRLIQAFFLISQNSVRLVHKKLHLSSHVGPLCTTAGDKDELKQSTESTAAKWLPGAYCLHYNRA